MNRWRRLDCERERIIMWGASDQARVNIPIIRERGCELTALVDDTPNLISPVPSIPLFRGWAELEPWLKSQDGIEYGFVVAIGNPYGHVRSRLHTLLLRAGLEPVTLADRSVKICATAKVGSGLQAMPDVIVHNDAQIGRDCILNTRSLVEHDCVLGDGVEIGPGATLAGRVHVGANSWICTGASIRPRVRIGANTIIGAGAVVVSDIPDDVVAVGVPARVIKGRTTPSAEFAVRASS